MITRTFKLCLNAGTGSAPYINVSQYDEGETWLFELYSETGERYIPSTGAIVGVKSDGHGIINTGTVDNEGRVVITETQQMTASAGRAIFELSIDGLTHGTANFIVAVERKPTDEAVMSDSDLSLIQEAVDSAAVIVEVIGDSDPSEVIGEHVDDWLDNHPEATTTVQDGAITAPKINNSLWDKLLVSEEASGAVASFDDGADDVPVSSLKVNLEPVQWGSGDPSPSNVRPIYPANNRNQFPTTADGTYTYAGVTVVANNGVYTVTGTATATSYIELALTTSIDLSPATNQFAFLNSVADGNIEFAVYRDSTRVHYWAMSPQNRVTVNWPDTGNEVVNKIRFNFQNGKTYNITISPVLCLATYPTPVTFTPYQGIVVERKGVNLFDASVANHGKRWKSAGLETMSNVSASAKIPCLPNTEYYLHDVAGENNGVPAVYFWDADNTYISNVVIQGTSPVSQMITTPAGTAYMGINYMTAQESTVGVNCNGVTEYVPYEGETYPISLGQSVYGGTVDLATGVLTVDRAVVTLNGSETWGAGSANQGYYTEIDAMLRLSDYETAIICDRLKAYRSQNAGAYTSAESGITGYSSSSFLNQNWIYAKGGNATTAAEFKTWLASNPLQVVYLLATPTTVQLTPQEVKTLLGYNNISSSGTVEVIYHADTKLYVDKMTAVDNNIIAPTEKDYVATQNYTTNDLVIVNDTLYKVTSNIASGSAITPNSNVQQTTLSALIKALS